MYPALIIKIGFGHLRVGSPIIILLHRADMYRQHGAPTPEDPRPAPPPTAASAARRYRPSENMDDDINARYQAFVV